MRNAAGRAAQRRATVELTISSTGRYNASTVRPPISYTIDSSDVIVEVNHAWFDFAHGNDAADLAAAAVGRPLWSFIAGATVRGVYKDLLQRVREGAVVSIPFRCDSPSVRREMTLTMRPLENGAVQFESSLVAETQQAVIDTPVSGLVHACSWCKRVLCESDWLDLEAAVRRLGLFLSDAEHLISHTICPECEQRVTALEG